MAGLAENGREQSLKQQTGTYLANFFDGAKEAVGQYLSNIGRELRAEIRADREAMRADMAELRAATEILARDRVGLLELKTAIETRLAAVRDGEPGPPGPEGAQGPQGTGGERGEQGSPGTDGREWQMHGLFEPDANYSRGSVVVLDGGAFVAIKDDPGPCPGDGWRLLVQRGKAGKQGEAGPRGLPGPDGKPGKTILMLKFLRGYRAVAVYDDGTEGEPFSIREAFAQYDAEKTS